MKYKIAFRLDWLEMIFILIMTFFSGMLFLSDMENKFIYMGLLLFGAGISMVKNRVKLPVKNNNRMKT